MQINLIYKLKIKRQHISSLKKNQTVQVNSLPLCLAIKKLAFVYDSGLIIRNNHIQRMTES